MKKIALVYMVGGMSSRFGGRNKAFAKIGPDKEPLIEISINQALKSKFSEIIFIVSEKTKQDFRSFFGEDYQGVPIRYVLQKFDENTRDKPWGTADALCSARDLIDYDFVICNGDDIYGEETFKILFDHLQDSDEPATVGYNLGEVLPGEGAVNRGIFEIENGYLKGIKEHFNISKERLNEFGLNENSSSSQNIFALNIKTFKLLDGRLMEFKKENKGNRKIECLLPEELSGLINEGKIRIKIYQTSGKYFGITNPEDEEKVFAEMKALNISST